MSNNNVIHLTKPYAIEFMDSDYRYHTTIHINALSIDNADRQAENYAIEHDYEAWAIYPIQ